MLFVQKTAIIWFFLVVGLSGKIVVAQDAWPKEVVYKGGGVVTIYQPQPESLSGDKMAARAAVSVREKAGEEPVFGVMWLDAFLSTDKKSGMAEVKEVEVRRSRFAEEEGISSTDFKNAVERGFPGLRVRLATQDILAAIKQEQGVEDLKNDPPRIIYRDRPTTLIVLDGEPVEEKDEELKVTRVVNTPYLIIKNPDDKKYYLYGGSFWYASDRVKDGWKNVKKLPSRIKAIDAKMKEEEKKASAENETVSRFTTPTEILVVTEPAELIQTEGKPTYQAVQGSTLLYVNNSLDEIFKDIDTQRNYILLAGRWYSSASLNGPWDYVPQDILPEAFKEIPAGSEKDGVLASVSGTTEAEMAVMDAYVPQTAKVDRSTARVEVYYDGDPYFAPIENTNLAVAENSNITVMRAANNRYYALENGIWFVSTGAYGPWQVANERPSDVDRIPPSNSAYNARYVQIYESTPQYVYVGYTQGYMGNYIYGPTVVWGTGWRYRPWRGRYYRARPVTWGFGMHYNPWVGWTMSFGLGFNVGWYHYRYAYSPYAGGWFGPPAYRPPSRPWGWNGGYYGNRPPAYRQRPVVVVNRPVNVVRQPTVYRASNNLYRNRTAVVVTRDVSRPVSRVNVGRTGPEGNSSGRPTNRSGSSRETTGNRSSERQSTSRPSSEGREATSPGRTRSTTGNERSANPPATTNPQRGGEDRSHESTSPARGSNNRRETPVDRTQQPEQRNVRPRASQPSSRPPVTETPARSGQSEQRGQLPEERSSPVRQESRSSSPAASPRESGPETRPSRSVPTPSARPSGQQPATRQAPQTPSRSTASPTRNATRPDRTPADRTAPRNERE